MPVALGAGRHNKSNRKNTSCSLPDCDTNITLCKKHEKINAEKHRLYKAALKWKQRVSTGQAYDDQEDYAYLITVPEETKSKCTAILDDMDQTRREIHLKYGSDMREIFACYRSQLSKDENAEEIKQVTLGITEDRRENTSQFDLA